MISVSDGQARILAQVITVAPPELIPVGRCLGRVTAEDVRSSMDVPPTDNSAVDGYAVGSRDIPAGGTMPFTLLAAETSHLSELGEVTSIDVEEPVHAATNAASAHAIYSRARIARVQAASALPDMHDVAQNGSAVFPNVLRRP